MSIHMHTHTREMLKLLSAAAAAATPPSSCNVDVDQKSRKKHSCQNWYGKRKWKKKKRDRKLHNGKIFYRERRQKSDEFVQFFSFFFLLRNVTAGKHVYITTSTMNAQTLNEWENTQQELDQKFSWELTKQAGETTTIFIHRR